MIQLQNGLEISADLNYDLYDLSCLMTRINHVYGDEIELHITL